MESEEEDVSREEAAEAFFLSREAGGRLLIEADVGPNSTTFFISVCN